jgi:hypothetical protein
MSPLVIALVLTGFISMGIGLRKVPREERAGWIAVRIMRVIGTAATLIALGGLLGPRLVVRLYSFRPVPQSTEVDLFQGIHYSREVRREPVPMVIHVVKIDLDAEGVQFLVTPPDRSCGLEHCAQTTSQFLEQSQVQLAINGDFFVPWHDIGPLDYYPHPGDPVDALGFASSRGEIYSDVRANHSTVFIYEDNRVSFDERIDEVYNAISGNVLIVQDGTPINQSDHPYFVNRHPRTVIGLDASGRTLILIVIDGRQNNYSMGATVPELAQISIDYGAVTVLNMDGGGSAALVIQGENERAIQLNAPIHNGIPYRERPIANHLGVYALPLIPEP